jgi:hypothetical protein
VHPLEENDNSAMDFMCDVLTELAIEHYIAVDVPLLAGPSGRDQAMLFLRAGGGNGPNLPLWPSFISGVRELGVRFNFELRARNWDFGLQGLTS